MYKHICFVLVGFVSLCAGIEYGQEYSNFGEEQICFRPSCDSMSKWSQNRVDVFNKNVLYNYFIELSGSNITDFPKIASKYVSKDLYIQHDPNIGDGLDSLIEYFSAFKGPPAFFSIAHMSSENNHVWIHMKISVGGKETASIEIFRFICGWIVEHWIVSTEMKANGPFANTHPYF